jgi:hypothetical protein
MYRLLLCALLFGAWTAHGELHDVFPGMFIQDAVNASAYGDTVLLEEGVYTETVLLNGRTITIGSRYLLDGDTNHVIMTAVLPDSLRPDTQSCFVYVGGEGPASRLAGLTLESGRGTRHYEYYNVRAGGAIYLKAITSPSGISIERCDFRTCRAVLGGAVYARGYTQRAQMTLTNCRFFGDFAEEFGGGLMVDACVLAALHCTFDACSTAFYMNTYGSGLYAYASVLQMDSCQFGACVSGGAAAVEVHQSSGSISGCQFEANENLGPGVASDLWTWFSDLTVTGCLFRNNTCGVAAIVLDGQVHHSFVGNVVENGYASRLTGSLMLTAPYGDVAYNVIRNNTNVAGGAIYVVQNGVPSTFERIHHNVITGNVSMNPDRPSALASVATRVHADSNLIVGNTGPAVDFVPGAPPATIDARYNWWGHPSGPYHPTQNPGGQGDTLLSDSVLFIPWLTEPPDTTMPPNYLSVRERPEVASTWILMNAYPNPFNQSVTLVLAGFTGPDFEVVLYNLLGEQVDIVHRGVLTGGQLHYQAPPWLASGVYLLSARDKHSVQTKKVILMK